MTIGPDQLPRHDRLPAWVKVKLPGGGRYAGVRQQIETLGLHTVCEAAHCPNKSDCWDSGTATLMILGNVCTRSCRFCRVTPGRPLPPAPDEPARVAAAAQAMQLQHVVITSVDRDDLADGGAQQFVATVAALRAALPSATIELLTPDFAGNRTAIDRVAHCGAQVVGHNVETVARLTPAVRDQRASYTLSLAVLAATRAANPCLIVKSSLMLGLGETLDELRQAMRELRQVGVDWLTLGQYLRPSRRQLPVAQFYPPAVFTELAAEARQLGFPLVTAGPLVRSSYRAGHAQIADLIAARRTALAFVTNPRG